MFRLLYSNNLSISKVDHYSTSHTATVLLQSCHATLSSHVSSLSAFSSLTVSHIHIATALGTSAPNEIIKGLLNPLLRIHTPQHPSLTTTHTHTRTHSDPVVHTASCVSAVVMTVCHSTVYHITHRVGKTSSWKFIWWVDDIAVNGLQLAMCML